jgi:hypothetical protein
MAISFVRKKSSVHFHSLRSLSRAFPLLAFSLPSPSAHSRTLCGYKIHALVSKDTKTASDRKSQCMSKTSALFARVPLHPEYLPIFSNEGCNYVGATAFIITPAKLHIPSAFAKRKVGLRLISRESRTDASIAST